MSVFTPFTGMPGTTAEKIAKHRVLGGDGYFETLPGGLVLDGTKTRDPDNPDYPTDTLAQQRLRAGLLLGKVSASGKYANSVVGVTAGALAQGGTTITLSTAEAVELARRVGPSGNLTLTGPPVAAGTVRSLTVAFSGVNVTNGQVTITSPSVNDVWTLTIAGTLTAGNFFLYLTDLNGVRQVTAPIAYNANAAAIQAAINAVLGANATAVAGTEASFTVTFSGTGYAGVAQAAPVGIDTSGLTGEGAATITKTTAAVDGRFVTGSFVGDTDGSQVPLTFLPPGWELVLPGDGVSDLPLRNPPIAGLFDASLLLPYPADASLQAWVRAALNTYGKFVFSNPY